MNGALDIATVADSDPRTYHFHSALSPIGLTQEDPMVPHNGGCHCGRVRFEVIAPARLTVADCNCSICAKSGFLHIVVPKSRFRLLQGEESLTTYTFNTQVAKHFFCSVCGVKSFYIPRSHPDGYSVNARCIDEGTIEDMRIEPFNGREWEKQRPEGRWAQPD